MYHPSGAGRHRIWCMDGTSEGTMHPQWCQRSVSAPTNVFVCCTRSCIVRGSVFVSRAKLDRHRVSKIDYCWCRSLLCRLHLESSSYTHHYPTESWYPVVCLYSFYFDDQHRVARIRILWYVRTISVLTTSTASCADEEKEVRMTSIRHGSNL